MYDTKIIGADTARIIHAVTVFAPICTVTVFAPVAVCAACCSVLQCVVMCCSACGVCVSLQKWHARRV